LAISDASFQSILGTFGLPPWLSEFLAWIHFQHRAAGEVDPPEYSQGEVDRWVGEITFERFIEERRDIFVVKPSAWPARFLMGGVRRGMIWWLLRK
jgi:hypothetical protein